MLFGSSILALALGMIFFYFLLSILCSHINELIAGLLNRRGKDLIKGVQDLLNYPPAQGEASKLIEELPDDASAMMRQTKTLVDRNEFGELLLQHPLIQGLATQPLWLWPWQRADKQQKSSSEQRPAAHRPRTPDYIPDHTFSLALIGVLLDVSEYMHKHGALRQNGGSSPTAAPASVMDSTAEALQSAKTQAISDDPAAALARMTDRQALARIRASIEYLPDGPRRALLPFIQNSPDSIEKLRSSLEHWYNAKMDRVSGVYKRRTQVWLLVIGLIATLMLNADSLAVVTALWQYPTLREAIAEQAGQTAAASPAPSPVLSPEVSDQLSLIQQDVQNLLVFPITWGKECAYNHWQGVTTRADDQGARSQQPGRVVPFDLPNCRPQFSPLDVSAWFWKLIGFIITAFAISLGSSFWFDLLRKVSNLRSSGPAPGEPTATATAQKPREV